MIKVLAAIADDAATAGVLATAQAVAKLHAATVEAVHVGDAGVAGALADAAAAAGVTLRTVAGTPVEALARASAAEDVEAVVLGVTGGASPAGTTAMALIASVDKPVVVVPRDGFAAGRSIGRVLVPLDGTDESAAALDAIVKLVCDAAVAVVVAHVYEEDSLPAFSDQLAHEVRASNEEFIARNCPGAVDVTLEMRVGEPQQQVLDILHESEFDLVALAWSQDLSPGRAAVVRRMLLEAAIPVLLTPMHRDSGLELLATDGSDDRRAL